MILCNIKSYSQVACPPNIGLELGNFSNWYLYTGSCCPISTPTLSGAVAGRHTITSGAGVDLYGLFPVVAPASGVYSLKIGNSSTGAQAERARYYIQVPASVNNYSIIFRYAVVLEDPGHAASEQPRFEVKAYDSATNAAINCSQFIYVSSSSLPGFALSSTGLNVYYKSWATESIDLSGYAGRTVALDVASGDCSLSAHFGYGYIDMSCGLFQISYNACDTSSTITLNAPPGFQSYSWYDSATWVGVGTGQPLTIARPTTNKTYAVILTPYAGFGCPDTLYTKVYVNNLSLNPTNDTTLCNAASTFQLQAGATASATPITYNWTPSTGLSCTTCANPVATVSVSRTYYITATDAQGCSKTDSVRLTVSNPTVSLSKQNITCNGINNGQITATPSNGSIPYSYSWNTSPTQTTATISNLPVGNYVVTVTDAKGCVVRDSAAITQPLQLNTSIINQTNIGCSGLSNGTATSSTTGGTAPYTYNWNTTPAQTTANASALGAGTYTLIVTDSNGCADTATVIITQPNTLAASVSAHTKINCHGGNNGTATVTVTGGTMPYTYQWNTTPVQTSATATGLAAGTYIATVTDSNGCTDTAVIVLSQPSILNASISAAGNNTCFGVNNGTATATVTGGTTPYTYQWNTTPVQTGATATNLAAGNYTVTVTDSSGCTDTATVVITQPTVLNATISNKTNTSCFGSNNGNATVVASGGTAPYTISWNTSPVQTSSTATGLAAGIYIATVTDSNGCTDTAIVTITSPTTVNATISSYTPATCFGANNGTATTTVSGGTSPYIYNWNTSPVQTTATATGLAAGIYTVTVTDSAGCSDTAIINLSQPSGVNAAIDTQININCFGGNNGAAVAIGSGGVPPYTYLWNTSPAQTGTTATGLSAGTYIVTLSDNNGCTDTAIVTITQPAQLNAAITNPVNISCNGGNNGSAIASVTGGTSPYTYSWNTSPIQTTATATGLTAGTYTVQVTDNKGCADTAMVTISQPALLNAGISGVSNINCNGNNNGSATVSAIGGTLPYSYSWNTSPAQTTTTATGLTAGIYIATVTDGNGCIDTAMVTIAQPTALNAQISNTVHVSCNGGNNGAASVTVSGGTTPYSYSWNTTPIQTTATATNLLAGSYAVVVTDNNGCKDTATITITQPSILNASISSFNTPTCFGVNNGSATAITSGGKSPYTYSWNTTPVQTTATATGLSAGSYIVTVTDSNGCTDTANITLSQPTILNASISATTHVNCNGGNTGTAAGIVSGGTSPYTYSWSTSPVQTTATAINLQAGTYTLTITDSKGCIDTAIATINQPTLLNAAISTFANISCFGGNNGSAVTSVSGGAPPYTYAWNTLPSQTTANANNLAAGTYIVSVTDNNGCKDTASITITQPNALNATISSTTQVSCYGLSNGSISVTTTGGTTPYTYNWNTTPVQTGANATGLPFGTYTAIVTDNNGCKDTVTATLTQPTPLQVNINAYANVRCYNGNDGTATVTASGGVVPYTYNWNTSPAQTTTTATTLTAGTYIVSVTDNNNCTNSDTIVITQPQAISFETEDIAKTCRGENNGIAIIKNIAGGIAPYSISWNTNPAQTSDTVKKLASGNYQVVVTDVNGCTQNGNVTITEFPETNITASPDQRICQNKSIALSVSGAATYVWQPSTSLSCSTCDNPVASPKVNTTYNVIGTDINGCKDTASTSVVIITKGTVMVGADREICPGNTVALEAEGGTDYEWSPNLWIDDKHSNKPMASPDTTIRYRVIIKQADCYADTLYQTVKVYPMPTVDLGPDIDAFVGEEILLKAITSNTKNIQWTPVTNLSCNNCYSTKAVVNNNITYKAIVYNEIGCTDEDDIRIKVTCDGSSLFIPNTFTPNKDGVNDVFYPIVKGISTLSYFAVYSRWGEKIFEVRNIKTNDPKYGWDGTFKGQELPPDVFVYMIEAYCNNGERIFRKGDISIVR